MRFGFLIGLLLVTTVGAASIYSLDGSWRTQTAAPFKLRELRGKPRVLALIFTHCQGACPRLVADLKAIQSQSPPEVGFVLVSIDPGRDNPARLREFAREQHLQGDWTLLTGPSRQVEDLAAVLGFSYRKLSNGNFAHSNLITVLSKEGEIVFQQDGLGKPASAVVAELHKQLR